MADDFNLNFIKNLESTGCSPFLKKHILFEIVILNKTFNLYDIWRVILIKKLFTFRQKYFTDITQQRLDYIFISDSLQESVKILNALSFDCSRVFCSFVNNEIFVLGSGVWKFNNSLLFNIEFVKKSKIDIGTIRSNLLEKSTFSDCSK